VDVADLAAYAEHARAAVNITAGAIVVPKGAIQAASGAANKDFAQTLKDRLGETIDKTSAAIKSGKLSGPDLARSSFLRSGALSNLGQFEKALADANEALKLTPNAPAALACRAYVFFGAGEFERSVADYSKAVALGDVEAKIRQERGIARFYAGKLEE